MFLRMPLAIVLTLVLAVPDLVQAAKDEPWVKFSLTRDEQAAIAKYYKQYPARAQEPAPAKKQKQLPPGLKKKIERGGELPPGWQKKVARGEVMDPVVYRQARPIPADLIRILPPQPKGTTIIVVEGKAVRLWEATRTIIDVLDL
ncbi:MAG: hypothetical protein HYU77_14405 [Betaproteobacteria bacterium]|nr:hypothetical protein [Betaproteobacteria bacterium]